MVVITETVSELTFQEGPQMTLFIFHKIYLLK